jgi:hypothetical protein
MGFFHKPLGRGLHPDCVALALSCGFPLALARGPNCVSCTLPDGFPSRLRKGSIPTVFARTARTGGPQPGVGCGAGSQASGFLHGGRRLPATISMISVHARPANGLAAPGGKAERSTPHAEGPTGPGPPAPRSQETLRQPIARPRPFMQRPAWRPPGDLRSASSR